MHYPLFSDIVRTRTAALLLNRDPVRTVIMDGTGAQYQPFAGVFMRAIRGVKPVYLQSPALFCRRSGSGWHPVDRGYFTAPSRGTRCGRMPVICSRIFSIWFGPPPMQVEPEPVMARHAPVISAEGAIARLWFGRRWRINKGTWLRGVGGGIR